MSKNPVLYKTLVVGVIVLFIGVGVQPALAIVEPNEEIINVEPKDYLFQTIIDIANNQDVKNLFEKYKYDLFKVDIDRSVYRKILFRNPRLFRSLIFTKPSLTYVFLDKTYNNGIEITNIIGEDKVIETIENVRITDIKLFDEYNNIITKDEKLSNRLAILEELNKEKKPTNPFKDKPLICSILLITSVIGWLLWELSLPFVILLGYFFYDKIRIISYISFFISGLFVSFMAGSLVLMYIFECFEVPIYTE